MPLSQYQGQVYNRIELRMNTNADFIIVQINKLAQPHTVTFLFHYPLSAVEDTQMAISTLRILAGDLGWRSDRGGWETIPYEVQTIELDKRSESIQNLRTNACQ